MDEAWLTLFDKKIPYSQNLDILKERFEHNWNKNQPSPFGGLDDYEQKGILGIGSFGTVILCRNKNNGNCVAMKVLVKEQLLKQNQVRHIIIEKKVLQAVFFPFVVSLECSMKDGAFLYLGMPFINGGELYSYQRKMKNFHEKQARFYAAQVFLALEYLHHLNLVYRDLKPENILIDATGYIKLTDFGFCKRIEGRKTWTFCGTPEYLAPEIIKSKAYGKSVDWWAFGVFIYELTAGYTPFITDSNDPMSMYERICLAKYKILPYFSNELKNLLQKLLVVEVTLRIGDLKNGSNDIKDDEWFKSVNWSGLLLREIEPFYIPTVKDVDDTSNFDRYSEGDLFRAKTVFSDQFADF